MASQMNSAASPEEQQLLQAFQQQQLVFEQATQFLNTVSGQVAAESPLTSAVMGDLQRWLERIGVVQQAASRARQAFECSGRSLTAAGRAEVAAREQTLRNFQALVDRVLQQLQNCRTELVPHLDSDVRRRSMHSAYQASLKTC
jgi:hypothetical protein